MQTPDILDIVPEPVVDPIRRAPWRVRLLTGGGDALLSLLLNGLVVAGLIGVGWPLHPAEAPSAISVDLVDHMPGETPGGAASPATPAEKAAGTEIKPHGTATETASASSPESKAAEPDHKAASEPQPATPVPVSPAPKPASEAATPPTEPPRDAERPDETASATTQATPPSEPPASQPAAPPPPEHPDDHPEGRLVEAPSAPPPAPIQTEQPATAVPPPAESQQAEAPTKPEAQRPILSAPDGSDTVATPTPPPETTAPAEAKPQLEVPKPLTAKQQREAAATAALAAMLPFGSTIEASPFQAAAVSQGQGASTAYRGAVYANFNKAQDVIAEARAQHLKGQAVIAFSIDDHGGLATIGVAVSSGNPAVDQAALELIRRAAPFPPPPPGAQRAFSPAIGLGLDE